MDERNSAGELDMRQAGGSVFHLAAPKFRKAILSAFLLLCSHGKKNDTAMLRKFLRKVLGISLMLRKSLRKVLGVDLPTVGSRVLCTCTADIVLQCSPCSDVHARGTSSFGTASCMSCFGYFVSWPGLFRFGAAETSFRGILLLNDR